MREMVQGSAHAACVRETPGRSGLALGSDCGSVRHMRVRAAGVAGSSPRLAEVRRFSHIAHGTRTGGRSRVRTVRYCLYDVYSIHVQLECTGAYSPRARSDRASHAPEPQTHTGRHRYGTQSCTANVLCAATLFRHACAALQAPGSHQSPASQHVWRHAGGDTIRTSSSAEPAWRALDAQQLSMKISVARRLSSSPATQARPVRSAQAI
jgi:hypothetical protein